MGDSFPVMKNIKGTVHPKIKIIALLAHVVPKPVWLLFFTGRVKETLGRILQGLNDSVTIHFLFKLVTEAVFFCVTEFVFFG